MKLLALASLKSETCGSLPNELRAKRPEHKPQGDPCKLCNLPFAKHRGPRKNRTRKDKRAYHAPKGDPCAHCFLPAKQHRVRPPRPKKKKKPVVAPEGKTIVGVDGEGHDTPDGRHIYTLLSASDEDGNVVAEAYNPNGLTHDECVNMLLSIPKNTLKFWFMGGYDITKIVQELPSADIYYLFRPELRKVRICFSCKHKWKSQEKECSKCGGMSREFRPSHVYKSRGYDWFAGSFTVRAGYEKGKNGKPGKWTKSSHIWDSFRFFGKSFVESLKDWSIGTPEQIKRIASMKAKRGAFEVVDPEKIRDYCREECVLLAKMMRKVINAHETAGLLLERYEGAGSTASVMLKKHYVKAYLGPKADDLDPGLKHAIMASFFGGRFENSAIGSFAGNVDGYDVSSAYPYALTHLACLKCGIWKRVTGSQKKLVKEIERADYATARFSVGKLSDEERKKLAWGPLPFRDSDGSIAYATNFSGWAWKTELLTALKGWPDLVELEGEAWVYKTRCRHKPFAFMPEEYRRRNTWGKDGPGIAIKLGINAVYGKTAQSKGDAPPFQCWAVAGTVTATTRGQILEAILRMKDPWNVISVATDGISCLEQIELPAPVNTGTSDLKKPLGGWEYKNMPNGGFFAKPGVYFPLDAELKDIRARGVGRREIYKNMKRLVKGFDRWDRRSTKFKIRIWGRRFFGAKHCIMAFSRCSACDERWIGVPEQMCPKCKCVGDGFRTLQLKEKHCKECQAKLSDPKAKKKILRDAMAYGYTVDLAESLCGKCAKPIYGQWGKIPTDIRFDPHPKREAVMSEGGSYARLYVRDVEGVESLRYKAGKTTPQGEEARQAQDFALEQPDWDQSLPHPNDDLSDEGDM